jgi:hypothetical protein
MVGGTGAGAHTIFSDPFTENGVRQLIFYISLISGPFVVLFQAFVHLLRIAIFLSEYIFSFPKP